MLEDHCLPEGMGELSDLCRQRVLPPCPNPMPVSGSRMFGVIAGEAELAKLVENTFRHVNVALVNELAMVAGDLASTSGRRST